MQKLMQSSKKAPSSLLSASAAVPPLPSPCNMLSGHVQQPVQRAPSLTRQCDWKRVRQRVSCGQKRSVRVLCSAAVGIDLGTTNSVVAVFKQEDSRPTVIRDSCGAFTVPSVVSYVSNNSILVGQAAKQQAVVNPLNTFYSVKRVIGKTAHATQDLELVYDLDADEQGDVLLNCPAVGSSLRPQQVSAQILRHLLQLASQHLSGEVPEQVVITVPAYFNAHQRAATLEAATLAGIRQVSLLQEPVAAAMAFGFGKPYDAETLLVFDLGGGTYDLSLVDSFERIMEVLGTNGDPNLGGDDFDCALGAWLLQQQQQQQEASLEMLDPADLAAVLDVAEAAKCMLTNVQSTVVDLPVIRSGCQQRQRVVLSRQQMHAATAHLRQRLWLPLAALANDCKLEYQCNPSSLEQRLAAEAVGQANPNGSSGSSSGGSSNDCAASAAVDPYAPKPRQLTAVLLVGGATRMPIIQQGLQILTGLKPRSDVDPEQAVALGAAIQAAVLMGLSSGLEMMDGSYVEEQHARSTGFT